MKLSYTVKSNDTLSKIAKQHRLSLKELLAANPQISNPNAIQLNQKITIPSSLPTKIPGAPVAKCCPLVSTFEGSTTKANYFGFDYRTNRVATPGTDEYWKKAKPTFPASKLSRDGASWVSVGKGKETELEINFPNNTGVACISNCSFELVPQNIASVVTPKVNASGMRFKIKGDKEGEASLKVSCNGKTIGWYHVWCKEVAIIDADVSVILTDRTVATVPFAFQDLDDVLNDVFKQALLEVDLKNLGVVNLGKTIDAAESKAYTTAATPAFAGTRTIRRNHLSGVLDALDTAAQKSLKARVTTAYTVKAGDTLAAVASKHHLTLAELLQMNPPKAKKPQLKAGEVLYIPALKPRAGAYQLYWYVPANNPSGILGSVINVGASPAFSFMPDSATARNSMAHELGHSLGLRHPSDGSGASQFATHNLATINQAVSAEAATNTEPAIAARPAKSNVLANDPTNLMGYWPDRPNRTPLRYHQWLSVSRS